MAQESLLDSNWNINDEITAAELNPHGQEHQNLGSDGGFAEDVVPASAIAAHAFSYDPGMTDFADGLLDEEVNRISLQPGEALVIERVEFRGKGGVQDVRAGLLVRDETAGEKMGSANLGQTTKVSSKSDTESTVVVKVTNQTGIAIAAAPRVQGYITGV